MKNWVRIFLACSVLFGSTIFFGLWSLNQFDNAIDNLSASYIASISPANFFPQKNKNGLAFTSSTTIASITSPAALETIATSTDSNLSFIFPQEGDEVYIGCTYQISWQSSSTINLLEMTLIDAGTQEVIEPITSGLSKENAVKEKSHNLEWKVGIISPGKYYIKVSKINGVDTEKRSKTFTINETPKTTKEGQAVTCQKPNNSL
jgi:hypothetical protein